MVNRLPVYVKARQKLFLYLTIKTSKKGDVYVNHIQVGSDYHLSRHSGGVYHQKFKGSTIWSEKRIPIEDLHGAEWLNTVVINLDSFASKYEVEEKVLESLCELYFIVDVDRCRNVQVTFAILTEAGIPKFLEWAENFGEESHHIFREFNPIIGVLAVHPQSVKNLDYGIERLKRTVSNHRDY